MRKFILATAVIAALSAGAMAQNTTTDKPSNGAASSAMKANPNAMGANPTPATPSTATQTTTQDVPNNGQTFVQVQNTDMLSSNVVGLDIHNGQNDNIGKIQDVAFDTSKKVTGYILSVGGFLGMGTHYVAVSPDAVMVSYDAQNKVWKATMNATKDQLKSAPEFKYGGQWTASKS
ncbi:MAG TPA: PRC-barrel domain-containing protein [Gemmataceae bacterium]